MKKILQTLTLAFSLLLLSFQASAQTCEEREDKLLETIGGFSASFLYNSYGLIGSVTDAFENKAYDKEMVRDLMNAQKGLYDNLLNLMQKLIDEKMLKDVNDETYIQEAAEIIKGLKKQAQLLIDYSRNRNSDAQNALAEQRDKNWKDISKLMGIEEE